MKRHHIWATISGGVLLGFAFMFVPNWRGAAYTQCPTATDLVVVAPGNNSTVSGYIRLAASTNAYASNIIFRFKSSTGVVVAEAPGQPSADPRVWEKFSWPTASLPDGTYYMSAYGNFDMYGCESYPINIKISNANEVTPPPPPPPPAIQPQLHVKIMPTGWEGSTNVAAPFMASTVYVDQYGQARDVTPEAIYGWGTTLGSLTASGHKITWYSGPNGGTGEVRVAAKFNGLEARTTVPVKVYSQSTYETSPTTTQSTQPPPGTQPPPPAIKPFSTETEGCLSKALGAERLAQLKAGSINLTAGERLKIAACFQPNNIIPAQYAPVKPDDVRNLPVVDKKEVSAPEAKNEQVGEGSEKRTAIVLTGRAKPDTTIFLYVFSEPLVLSAKTDRDGNWRYLLENPLTPGKHEVYVTLEDEPQKFVRSQPLFIAIAQAAPGDDNPQGSSLVLEEDPLIERSGYIFAALIIMMIGLRILFRMRRKIKTKLRGA